MESDLQPMMLLALYCHQEHFHRQCTIRKDGVVIWEGEAVNDLIAFLLSGIWDDRLWEAALGISVETIERLRRQLPN